jgi:hypothetical protein
VICVRVLAPTEGLGGAALVDGVLQKLAHLVKEGVFLAPRPSAGVVALQFQGGEGGSPGIAVATVLLPWPCIRRIGSCVFTGWAHAVCTVSKKPDMLTQNDSNRNPE